MKEFFDKILRASRKWSDQFLIAAILSIIVIFGGMGLSEWIFNRLDVKAFFEKAFGSSNLAEFFDGYLVFFGIWIITFLVIVIFKSNRPMLKAWGYNKDGNNFSFALIGALLGFGTNAFCVLMSVLLNDIQISYFGFNPWIIFAFLFAVLIQSGAEEIVDRLYLYQKLRRRYKNPWVAIIGNGLIFMGLHVFNDGFTAIAGLQIVLVAIIFSLFVYYYDSLWAAICFHTMWNFTQNLIFGLPNSGKVSDYSIFVLEGTTATSGPFYDYTFGIEGSIGACGVLIVVLAVMILINRNKPEKHDYWAENGII